jgi:DNA-binding NarL/FixJ family response regulator
MCAGTLPDTLAFATLAKAEPVLPSSVAERSRRMAVIIDKRTIVRECLAHSMMSWSYDVRMLPSVEGCADLVSTLGCDIVILCGTGQTEIVDDLNVLHRDCGACPVLVICDLAGPDTVINALELGARGILPTSSSLGILNGVISLILSGGAYVPPDSMIAAQKTGGSASAQPASGQPFTPRQSAIIAAIRKGSPNKIIAYELGMCESTVKVHIRNIMKKLKVRNRTELAFKAYELRIGP